MKRRETDRSWPRFWFRGVRPTTTCNLSGFGLTKQWAAVKTLSLSIKVPPVCPLVEPHGGVASFDDLNQASDEVEAVRTVIPLAANSVDFHGDRLVHTFLLGAKVRLGRRGGSPSRTPRLPRP